MTFILHSEDKWPSTYRFSEETAAQAVHEVAQASRLFSFRDEAWYEYQGDWIPIDPAALPGKVRRAVP